MMIDDEIGVWSVLKGYPVLMRLVWYGVVSLGSSMVGYSVKKVVQYRREVMKGSMKGQSELEMKSKVNPVQMIVLECLKGRDVGVEVGEKDVKMIDWNGLDEAEKRKLENRLKYWEMLEDENSRRVPLGYDRLRNVLQFVHFYDKMKKLKEKKNRQNEKCIVKDSSGVWTNLSEEEQGDDLYLKDNTLLDFSEFPNKVNIVPIHNKYKREVLQDEDNKLEMFDPHTILQKEIQDDPHLLERIQKRKQLLSISQETLWKQIKQRNNQMKEIAD